MADDSRHDRFMQAFLKAEPRIYSYIRTLVFNRADAEDLLQEVASVLWQKYDQFQPGTRFDQWAYKVAYHQILAYRQKHRREKMVFSNDVLALIADKAVAMNDDWEEMLRALHECAEELPPEDRMLVHLRFKPHATNRSVAALLGRSESAVSRALSRAYSVLLRCIRRRAPSTRKGDRP